MARIARSFLFVPGNRPDRFDKALATGADAVILDLEDAVPDNAKLEAREHFLRWASASRAVMVRVNQQASPWFADDIAACRRAGAAGIVLPKAEGAASVAAIEEIAGTIPILPIIESAAGMADCENIARVRNVYRMVFGTMDFQLDLGIDGDGEELLAFRSRLVLASRLAGLAPPVDGVCVAINEPQRLRDDTHRARRLGFGGKLCIHPRQVAIVAECFEPSPEKIEWALNVIAAAEQANGSATRANGEMVDLPVIERARAILADRRPDETRLRD